MTSKLIPGLLACACVLFSAGCSTWLKAPEQKQSITVGSTSREQVLKHYGKPRVEKKHPSGRSILLYGQCHEILTVSARVADRGTLEIRQLELLLDPRGMVEDFSYSKSRLWMHRETWRFEIGERVTPEQAAKIETGKTTTSELESLLGKPTVVGLDFDSAKVLRWWCGRQSGANSINFQEFSVKVNSSGVAAEILVTNVLNVVPWDIKEQLADSFFR